jgi:hypothetical protein
LFLSELKLRSPEKRSCWKRQVDKIWQKIKARMVPKMN